MSNGVTIAAVSMHVPHDKKANLETYLRYIEEASAKGAQLLAFPECSLQGYTWAWNPLGFGYLHDDEQLRYFQENAETVPGPTTETMCREARKYDMYIQFGMAEKSNTSLGVRLYNSAVLVGPTGLVGVFRKMHQAPNPVFTLGDRFTVFDISLGKVGAIICADLNFPESVRCLALQGAEVVVNSTAWGMRGSDPKTDYSGYKYDLLTRAQALMNQVWMVHADQFGLDVRSKRCYYGHSRVVDPMGRTVVDTGHKEGLALAMVNLKNELKRSRSRDFVGLDLLRIRRPEAYHALCGK